MLRLSNNRAKKNNWTMSLRKKCTVFKYNQIFILNNILQTNKQVVNCTILKHDIVEKKHVCTMEFFYDGCHRNL